MEKIRKTTLWISIKKIIRKREKQTPEMARMENDLKAKLLEIQR